MTEDVTTPLETPPTAPKPPRRTRTAKRSKGRRKPRQKPPRAIVAVPAELPEPWEQQPGETDRAFEAFRIYRDMGPSRSQLKVGAALFPNRNRSAQRDGTIAKWSMDQQWSTRAGAWDRHVDEIRRAEAEKTIADMSKRQATEAAGFQALFIAPVRALLEKLKQNPAALDDMSISELTRLAELFARHYPNLARFERHARGIPDVVIEENVNVTARYELIEQALGDPDLTRQANELARKIDRRVRAVGE